MTEPKITYLDGLRGAAALIVVLAHFLQVFLPSMFEARPQVSHFAFDQWIPRTPFNLLFNGNFAVCLFFVLSGFVLSRRFFRYRKRSIVTAALLKRYFRLAFPAVCSLLLAYAVMKLDWNFYDDAREYTRATMPDPYTTAPSFAELLEQGFIHTFFGYGMAYNPVLWTMTYELFGSFLVYGLLLAFGKSRFRFVCYAAGLWLFRDSYYLGFVLGMLLSDLSAGAGRNLIALRPGFFPAAFGLLGLFLGSVPYVGWQGSVYAWLPLSPEGFPGAVTYRTAGAALVLVALLNSRPGQKLFASRPMAYFGKLSFSLYLVHFAVLCSFSCLLFLRLEGRLSYGLNILVTTLVSLPLVFALAHLMYRLIDMPVVGLLSRIRFAAYSGSDTGKGVRNAPTEAEVQLAGRTRATGPDS
ncbi:acyltransferase [Paenibacillus sp. UNC499MF]|uniref:acyltransferase family protein n=1 Tax=Paenibacillus sp. UNC499MF TaxID=1502751 RepID=UPI0008A0823E|nr:acyltransferase [Paenibacillus sp. UNC499MF]SEG68167.1 Peptidoglycan/LPS O-acetylase OafA/YrhL, contains acyltransferase and SGNH-hydrolase domains [Paenibacillus sp. UNC499MF]